MLEAVQRRMIILVDGFITTAGFLVTHAICPAIIDYVIFSHSSGENGHNKMLSHVGGRAVLDLDLRLGEGTGAALAFPIIQGSVAMLNEVTSFEEAKVNSLCKKTPSKETRTEQCDYVFSSMPVTELIDSMNGVVPEKIKEISGGLMYLSICTGHSGHYGT